MGPLDVLVTMYLGGILFPFCHLTLTSLLRIRRGFENEHAKHEAWMDGFETAKGRAHQAQEGTFRPMSKHDNDRALDEATRAFRHEHMTVYTRLLSDEEIAAIYHGAKAKPAVVTGSDSMAWLAILCGLGIVAATVTALWVLA